MCVRSQAVSVEAEAPPSPPAPSPPTSDVIARMFADMYVEVMNRNPSELWRFWAQGDHLPPAAAAYTELESTGAAEIISVESSADIDANSGRVQTMHVIMTTRELCADSTTNMKKKASVTRSFVLKPQRIVNGYFVADMSTELKVSVSVDEFYTFNGPPPTDLDLTADQIGRTFANMYVDVANRSPEELHRFWLTQGCNKEEQAAGVNSYTQREAVGSTELLLVTSHFNVNRRGVRAVHVFMITREMCPERNTHACVIRRLILEQSYSATKRCQFHIVMEEREVRP